MTEQDKKGKIEYLCKGVQILFGVATLGLWGVMMVGSFGIAAWSAYRMATIDVYKGKYQNLDVRKEVNKQGTNIILQEHGRCTAGDPYIYANVLRDGRVSNIVEYSDWLLGNKAVTRLHRFTDSSILEEAVQCATNKCLFFK